MIEFLKTYSPLFLIVLVAGMLYKDVYPIIEKKLNPSRSFYDRSWKGCTNCADYGKRRDGPKTRQPIKENPPPKRPASSKELRYARMGDDIAYKYCLCCKKKKSDKCKTAIEDKLKCRKREIREPHNRAAFMNAFNSGISGCK